jgi:hypothetical protein
MGRAIVTSFGRFDFDRPNDSLDEVFYWVMQVPSTDETGLLPVSMNVLDFEEDGLRHSWRELVPPPLGGEWVSIGKLTSTGQSLHSKAGASRFRASPITTGCWWRWAVNRGTWTTTGQSLRHSWSGLVPPTGMSFATT